MILRDRAIRDVAEAIGEEPIRVAWMVDPKAASEEYRAEKYAVEQRMLVLELQQRMWV